MHHLRKFVIFSTLTILLMMAAKWISILANLRLAFHSKVTLYAKQILAVIAKAPKATCKATIK